MKTQEFPLLDLFLELRKVGLPLGTDEYQLLLRALQAGFGTANRESLKQLCRTLWIKSADDDLRFSHLFDSHFMQLLAQPVASEVPSQPSSPDFSSDLPEAPIDMPSPPPDTEATLPATPPTPSEAISTLDVIVQAEDEVQVAQAAVLQVDSIDQESLPNHFISTDEYFPVTRRQMKQSWRYLRHPVREGTPIEIDIEATIKQVGRMGMLFEPILVPQRTNHVELLFLIDHGGSMAPFHILSHRLVETALRGGHLERKEEYLKKREGHPEKSGVYYFHNCPIDYLYHDPAHQEYVAISEFLTRQYSRQAAVLIFSDAGAARRGFNQERVDLTEHFVSRFKQQFRYLAWLNPMPRARWQDTTANKIAQFIPMFDLSRRGLDNAISVLRGRPTHFLHTPRPNYYE